MTEEKISVLYVDDEENNLISFKATFRLKYKVHTAISGGEALKILNGHTIHVIITDQRMPHMTGTELLMKLLDREDSPIRILLTGYADIETIIDAVNRGKIFHYLTKPWVENDLAQTIERAYKVFIAREKIKAMSEKLALSNEQLEYLVKEGLLP